MESTEKLMLLSVFGRLQNVIVGMCGDCRIMNIANEMYAATYKIHICLSMGSTNFSIVSVYIDMKQLQLRTHTISRENQFVVTRLTLIYL